MMHDGKENKEPVSVVPVAMEFIAGSVVKDDVSTASGGDPAQDISPRVTPVALFPPDHDDYEPRTIAGVHAPPGGWFFPCRGCRWMTTHEYEAQGHVIPLCSRCQRQLTTHADNQPMLLAQLVDIHTCWVKAGL